MAVIVPVVIDLMYFILFTSYQYRCTNLCPPGIMPFAQMPVDQVFGILNFGHWNLPFDLAQGGEPVEPFEIWFLVLEISMASVR